MSDETIFAGTVGQGVWRSVDGGETFQPSYTGMFMESEVRALAVHPNDPKTLYAGTDAGLYRTTDGGTHWERLTAPFDAGEGWQAGTILWSLLVHPADPETIFVGTCPPAVYRSRNGGASWHKCNIALTAECPPIRFSRVTTLLADPADPNTIWAGVEIDGLWCSRDGGETWESRSAGLSSMDIHALAILPGAGNRSSEGEANAYDNSAEANDETSDSANSDGKILIASTNNDLNISYDDGATWQPQNVSGTFPNRYCRGLLTLPDNPDAVLVGNGNGPPGTTGALFLSQDRAHSWQNANLPAPVNATVWTFAVSPVNPQLVFAATVLGQLFRSDDGGQTWRKCRHEFGELRALAVTSQ